MIIGLGTGRCGTQSLSRLLSAQPGAIVSHERKPHLSWCLDVRALEHKLSQIFSYEADIVGDVALYLLPYVEEILSRVPAAKFVVLQRGREETIGSYLKWIPNYNHWMRHDGSQWQTNYWDFCYPKYDAASRDEALQRYWDDYYSRVDLLIDRHPDSLRLFQIEELNTEEGVDRILEFCCFEQTHPVVGIRSNQRPVEPAEIQVEPAEIQVVPAEIQVEPAESWLDFFRRRVLGRKAARPLTSALPGKNG